jgi:hypothetical protein
MNDKEIIKLVIGTNCPQVELIFKNSRGKWSADRAPGSTILKMHRAESKIGKTIMKDLVPMASSRTALGCKRNGESNNERLVINFLPKHIDDTKNKNSINSEFMDNE